METWSLWFDVKIILRTIRQEFLFGSGDRADAFAEITMPSAASAWTGARRLQVVIRSGCCGGFTISPRASVSLTFKAVVRNAGWLGLVHGLNYAVPIVTVPVVARALGPNTYGILATFYAFCGLCRKVVLTVFGFNISGPRAIAGFASTMTYMHCREAISTIVAASGFNRCRGGRGVICGALAHSLQG